MDKPHDKLFRKIFDDVTYARDLLEAVLPADVVQAIDVHTLDRVPGNFIDDDGRETYTDLLYRCRLRSGGEAFCYVLVEHKSQATRWLVVDLLSYASQILQDESRQPGTRTLPVILPIGIVHDPQRKQSVTSLSQLTSESPVDRRALGDKGLSFGIFLADISEIDDRFLIEGPYSDAIKITFLALKHARDPQRLLEVFTEIRQLVRELLGTPRGHDLFYRLIDYTVRIAAGLLDVHAFATALRTKVEKMAGNIVTTVADKLREEGFQLGIKEGRREGIEEGQATMILRQLEVRFGPLPKGVSQRVESATLDELAIWSTSLLNASSIDDVFGQKDP